MSQIGRVLRALRRRIAKRLRDRYTVNGGVALVIPVHNDAEGLARLLGQVRKAGLFAQIIVVDDGSDIPLRPMPGVRLIRHPQARGGGIARNTGLGAVRKPYVMFFDADDLMTPDLGHLIGDLAAEIRPFDVCLFKYADSRVTAEGIRGQPDWDERFWTEAGVATGTLTEPPPSVWPVLAQTANYPWNKIFRTRFLRNNRVACAPTRVHQDIPLHWLAFLAARRMLVSDRVCAWHHVDPAGTRLTNRQGAERLEVFTALGPVMTRVAGSDPAWQAAFAAFVLGLMDWVAARIDPALQDSFRRSEADWLTRHLLPHAATMAGADPALPARLQDRIAKAAALPALSSGGGRS
jgi:glycosyltransferase involved in cell wall biosynthesis